MYVRATKENIQNISYKCKKCLYTFRYKRDVEN